MEAVEALVAFASASQHSIALTDKVVARLLGVRQQSLKPARAPRVEVESQHFASARHPSASVLDRVVIRPARAYSLRNKNI